MLNSKDFMLKNVTPALYRFLLISFKFEDNTFQIGHTNGKLWHRTSLELSYSGLKWHRTTPELCFSGLKWPRTTPEQYYCGLKWYRSTPELCYSGLTWHRTTPKLCLKCVLAC